MMVYDDKIVEMHKKVKPWLICSLEEGGMVVRDDAPEEIKELFDKLKNTKPIMPDLC